MTLSKITLDWDVSSTQCHPQTRRWQHRKIRGRPSTEWTRQEIEKEIELAQEQKRKLWKKIEDMDDYICDLDLRVMKMVHGIGRGDVVRQGGQRFLVVDVAGRAQGSDREPCFYQRKYKPDLIVRPQLQNGTWSKTVGLLGHYGWVRERRLTDV